MIVKLENAKFRAELDIRLEDKDAHAPRLTTDLTPLDGETFRQLSICASVWSRSSRGRWLEHSAGQCVDTIREEFGSNPDVARLCELWDRWHLNGMKAGTAKQNEALVDMSPAVYPESHYDVALKRLAEYGLATDRGYKYGHAWLVEPLPADVETELQALVARLS